MKRAAVCVVLATGMTPLPGADDFVEEPRPPQPVPAFPQPVPFVLPFRAQAPAPRVDGPSLGIWTAPVPPAVRAQVDVPDGVGLLVERLAEDGPAGEAGLQQFDLLVKFDDQLVCSPQQLDTLVRVAGVGAKASLTIRRGGKERVFEATVEERADGLQPLPVGPGGPWQPPPVGAFPGGPPGADGLAEEIRRRVEEALRAAQPGFAVPPDGFMPPLPVPALPPGLGPVPLPPARSQGMAVVSDAAGPIELREQDGALTVTIRDSAGKQIHSGPLDTESDREAVPEEFRDKVRAAEGRLGRGGPPRPEPPAARPPQALPPLKPAPEPERRKAAPTDSTEI
jgi:hypothetical protein